jgi:protein-export membrane protein SecD
MHRRNLIVFTLLLVVFGLSLWTVLPINSVRLGREGMRLGLDLVGGVQLVYQAQFPEGASADQKAADMSRALDSIERRINKYGVTEPVIQQQGEDRILIQLPGFTDITTARSLAEQTGFLEFRSVELDAQGEAVYLSDYLDNTTADFINKDNPGDRIFVDNDGNPLVFLEKDTQGNLGFFDDAGNALTQDQVKTLADGVTSESGAGSSVLLSWAPARGDDGTQLTGSFLKEATPGIVGQTTGNEYDVNIEWNDQGSLIFDQIAKRIYDSGAYGSPQRALGIFLDKALISYPQILEPAYNGKASITGNFTSSEVSHLANLLNSGALPMPLQKPPLFQGKISATLGASFIDRSLTAGLIGIILVMVFMSVYYRIPGVLSSLALIFYGALVLAIFKLIPVTLTLAGIGGFIVSVGMAVDANVLIFERLKEELRAGRTLEAAIEAGFKRAWSSIWDSNITTFIACGILYWLGSSLVASATVKGFAVTLFIGVAVSMFTAIVVTRTLLRLVVRSRWARRISLFTPYLGRGQNV